MMHTRRGNDYMILLITVLLITFGMAMVGSASSHLSEARLGDSWYYIHHQLLYGFGVGLIGFIIASYIQRKHYERYAVLGMIIGIGLLMLTFTPLAFETKGAARWVRIGPTTFQPAEPLKIFFIIYIAAWLHGNKNRVRNTTARFITFLVILGGVMGLLLQQPATSTAALLAAVAIIMYFISGLNMKHFLIMILMLIIVLGGIIYATPYRRTRIEAFLRPGENTQTSGYQVNQAKIAIGAGGIWGAGYGQSKTKIQSLPEPLADSIFAVIGEELGFIGALTLLGLILALVLRIFFIARETRDEFGKLLLTGFGSLIALQSAINIAAISGLMPITGMPLPFISYGGTALAVFITIIGIVNNIARNQ